MTTHAVDLKRLAIASLSSLISMAALLPWIYVIMVPGGPFGPDEPMPLIPERASLPLYLANGGFLLLMVPHFLAQRRWVLHQPIRSWRLLGLAFWVALTSTVFGGAFYYTLSGEVETVAYFGAGAAIFVLSIWILVQSMTDALIRQLEPAEETAFDVFSAPPQLTKRR